MTRTVVQASKSQDAATLGGRRRGRTRAAPIPTGRCRLVGPAGQQGRRGRSCWTRFDVVDRSGEGGSGGAMRPRTVWRLSSRDQVPGSRQSRRSCRRACARPGTSHGSFCSPAGRHWTLTMSALGACHTTRARGLAFWSTLWRRCWRTDRASAGPCQEGALCHGQRPRSRPRHSRSPPSMLTSGSMSPATAAT